MKNYRFPADDKKIAVLKAIKTIKVKESFIRFKTPVLTKLTINPTS